MVKVLAAVAPVHFAEPAQEPPVCVVMVAQAPVPVRVAAEPVATGAVVMDGALITGPVSVLFVSVSVPVSVPVVVGLVSTGEVKVLFVSVCVAVSRIGVPAASGQTTDRLPVAALVCEVSVLAAAPTFKAPKGRAAVPIVETPTLTGTTFPVTRPALNTSACECVFTPVKAKISAS